jgi:23S rRNA pseudouridine1911/1915/1917 synthase
VTPAPRTLDLSVPAPSAGERLDRFLARAQPDLSRSRLQSLILGGRVTVNGKPRRASHRLLAGDRVCVDVPAPEAATLEPEALPLDIVHEDADLLVLDKPAGLVVHPGAGVGRGTLVHGLLHRDPAIAGVGGAGRPGIVHRLDKDTSGLMVVARTSGAYRGLIELIRRREIHRTYRALVWGDPTGDEGVIEGAIGRDPRDRKRMALVARGGKAARTLWRVEERFGAAALLEVRLDTGRTHQIRVHLASRRMPVVGDAVYGTSRKKRLSGGRGAGSLEAALHVQLSRQALHASNLEFPHPVGGQELRFTSPLPGDLARAIAILRASSERERSRDDMP